MPAERLPAEILQFVQPGRVIDPASGAKIYDFVTESGQNMGKVVEETVTGNNGILYTIRNFITTTGAAAGTYLTTGLAAAPVELSVASGAWMAALGIGGGALLYQSMPDLFNKISDAIFGDFVNGLPVLYFDRYGRLQVAEDTINTVKDTLIENKAYLDGFDLHGATSEYVTAIRNYTGALYDSTYTPQPVIDVYTDPDQLLEYCYSFIHKYSSKAYIDASTHPDYGNPWEYDYFCFDVYSKNEYYNVMKKFMDKYQTGQYIFGVSEEGGPYTPRTGLDYTIYAIPFKLLRSMTNQVPITLYCDYKNENGDRFENVALTATYRMKDQYNNTYFEQGNPYHTVYNGDTIGNSWASGLRIRPVDDNDCLGFLELVEPISSYNYYCWTDTYKLWKLEQSYRDVGGVRIEVNDYNAPDPDLCIYSCTPRGGESYNDLTRNKEYVGNVSYFDADPDLMIGDTVTTFLEPITNKILEMLHPMGVTNYSTYSSINFTNFPMNSKILVSDYIDNRWITPGATYPIAEEDVTTTYPTWPAEVAEGIGKLLTVTPQDLNPTTDQEVAQSPGLDIDPNKWIEYFRNILSQVNPNPEPAPDPSPSPEPIPQPDPDPAPAPVPVPDPDPANPNTPVTPDPNPVIPPNLNTVSSSRLFTVYWPTASELDLLGATLWSSNFITQMEKVWNDPMQGVISLKKVYALPQSTRSEFIILGNFDTTIMSRIVENQFVYTDCGILQVPEVMHNATDFTPYTQIAIYLPFIGIQELDADDIVGGRLHLIYRFDLYTGVCLAEIYVLRDDMNPEKILYCFTGNAAQEIPLTGSNAQGFFNTLMTIGGGAIVAASGGALTGAVGVAAVGHSMSHEMTHVGRSGNLSANAGIMGNRYPQIIISNRNRYDANGYNNIYGYPANKSVYLGNCKGFTKVKAINLHTFATQPEKDEIERLLKDGVIF